MKASVIDLGYNSLKLVNYLVKTDGTFQSYDQRGVMARLGDGLSQTGFLGDEPVRRTIKALKLFKDIIRLQQIEHVLTVATSPLREAGNSAEFLRQAEKETGFNFKVLTGKEEAYYSYLGAVKSTRTPDTLFFDLGGGSLELVNAKDFAIKKILSWPLGALKLTQLYSDEDGTFTKKGYAKMKERIDELLPERSELNLSDDTILLGVGGTIRAMARYDQEARSYPLSKLHNYEMTSESVELLNDDLQKMTVNELAKIDSIGASRAETVTAGTCVVNQLMKRLNFEKLRVSTHALREGMLTSYFESEVAYNRGEIDPLRVQNSLKYNGSLGRYLHVESFLTEMVEDSLISKWERRILEYALRKLSTETELLRPEIAFYVLLNEDSELSHTDQLLFALAVVRTKRPRIADWLLERYGMILERENRVYVKRIAACLEVVEILKKTGAHSTIETQTDGKLQLTVTPTHEDFPAELLRDALNQFERVFDKKVEPIIEYNVAEPH
jgi:exopolyphosphatase / guanosine-5'-triphosphate,3'-diphosphate pyrophosphatase